MLRDLDRHPVPTKAEAYELILAAQAGDLDARNNMVMRNMRLVVRVAMTKRGRGVDLEELIQEGVFGLIRAIEKFDCSTGLAFITYARPWVFQFVNKYALSNARLIKIPFSMFYRELDSIDQAIFDRAIRGCVSLDQPIKRQIDGHQAERAFVGALADHRSNKPTETIERDEQRAKLEASFNQLPERDQRVLRERAAGRTLEAIGNDLGVSKERTRQIESAAREKLASLIGLATV